jgi:hypothetical protein
MNLFLDSCMVNYLLNYSKFNYKNKMVDNNELKKNMGKYSITTDWIVIFEVLYHNKCEYTNFFSKINKLSSYYYIYSNRKDKDELYKSIKNANRNGDQNKEFFNKLSMMVSKIYAKQLQKLLDSYISVLVYCHLEFLDYDLKSQRFINMEKTISKIIKRSCERFYSILWKKILDLINTNKFNEDNVQKMFGNINCIICYYFNKIPAVKMSNLEIKNKYRSFNKDLINEDFNEIKNSKYNNIQEFINYDSSKNKGSKFDPNIFNIYDLEDFPVIKKVINNLFCKIYIKNKFRPFKIKFNDIKDGLVADDYLHWLKDNNDNTSLFITIDKELIKVLKTIDNENFNRSINNLSKILDDLCK